MNKLPVPTNLLQLSCWIFTFLIFSSYHSSPQHLCEHIITHKSTPTHANTRHNTPQHAKIEEKFYFLTKKERRLKTESSPKNNIKFNSQNNYSLLPSRKYDASMSATLTAKARGNISNAFETLFISCGVTSENPI